MLKRILRQLLSCVRACWGCSAVAAGAVLLLLLLPACLSSASTG
jgi:hypothetical protein